MENEQFSSLLHYLPFATRAAMNLHPECLLTLSALPACGRYLLGFLGLFLVPGRLAVGLLGLRRFRFLLSVALSYALLVLTLLALQGLGCPVSWFPMAVAAEILLLALGWAIRVWRRNLLRRIRPGHVHIRPGAYLFWQWRRLGIRRALVFIWLGLMAGLVGYLAYAGPYLELPSDALEHIRRAQLHAAMLDGDTTAADALADAGNNVAAPIRNGRWTPGSSPLKLLRCQSHHWYFLHAWLCRASGLPVERSALTLTFCTLVVFLSGAFAFALLVFARLRVSRRRKALAAAAAVAFLVLHLGTLVFAYVRYYALAPTMVNYVLFWAALALALEFLDRPGWRFKPLLLLGLITFTANAVHTQEALFVFFTCLAMTAVAAWRAWTARPADGPGARLISGAQGPARPTPPGGPASPPAVFAGAGKSALCQRRWKALVGLAVLGTIYGVLFAYLRGLPQQALDPRFVMPLQALLPFMNSLLIQPPWGQFYQTVTVWGLFVYLVWIVGRTHLNQGLYVTAGMLLPLFTVFNPLTVDIITRANAMTQGQLWRVSYALPLHLVAGWLAIAWLGGLVRRHQPLALRIRNALALALLVGLLFPWNTRYFANPCGRFQTLARVPANREAGFYADLIEQAGTWNRPRTRIITDPLTACVISRFTGVDCLNCQFLTTQFQDWLALARTDAEFSAVPASLDPAFDWFLVINRRDGGFSETGVQSRHWPGDVLKVGRHYSPELQAFVEAHPERFTRVWQQDRIAVYAVVREAERKNSDQ